MTIILALHTLFTFCLYGYAVSFDPWCDDIVQKIEKYMFISLCINAIVGIIEYIFLSFILLKTKGMI